MKYRYRIEHYSHPDFNYFTLFPKKRATVQDHVTHLEILREEMELVTRRKNDLEKKVEQLIFERDQLNAVLDESSDKILMLEKQTREQDCQVI